MQAHVVELLTNDQFKGKYPGAELADFASDDWNDVDAPWREGDAIQVAEYWKREKVIKKALMIQQPDGENGPGEAIIMFEDEYAAQKELLDKLGAQVIGVQAAVIGDGHVVQRRADLALLHRLDVGLEAERLLADAPLDDESASIRIADITALFVALRLAADQGVDAVQLQRRALDGHNASPVTGSTGVADRPKCARERLAKA